MFQWADTILSGLKGLVNSFNGNDRKKLENVLAQIEADITAKEFEVQKAAFEMHAKILSAESASPHKINAMWRPIASLTLVAIACLAAFDIISPNERFYDLLNLVLGGHIITSSASNGLQGITKVLSKK